MSGSSCHRNSGRCLKFLPELPLPSKWQAPGLSLRFMWPPLTELFDYRPKAQELFKLLREIVSRSEKHRFAIEHRNPHKTILALPLKSKCGGGRQKMTPPNRNVNKTISSYQFILNDHINRFA
jgi:hypothetical protein